MKKKSDLDTYRNTSYNFTESTPAEADPLHHSKYQNTVSAEDMMTDEMHQWLSKNKADISVNSTYSLYVKFKDVFNLNWDIDEFTQQLTLHNQRLNIADSRGDPEPLEQRTAAHTYKERQLPSRPGTAKKPISRKRRFANALFGCLFATHKTNRAHLKSRKNEIPADKMPLLGNYQNN